MRADRSHRYDEGHTQASQCSYPRCHSQITEGKALKASTALGRKKEKSAPVDLTRDLVVRERGGTPFRQIFWSRNGAPANIVGHRWNADTEAFRQITSYSLDQFIFWPKLPPNAGFGIKNLKKNSGGDDPLPHPPPARLHAVRGDASSPVAGTLVSETVPSNRNLPLHPWI